MVKNLNLKTFLTLLFLSVLIFFLDTRGLLDGPKNIVQTVTVPVQYSLYSTKLGAEELFSFLTFWKSGERRIMNLELRIMELAGADARAKSLEQENRELRKQLGATPKVITKLLPATVLGKDRYLEIAVGSNDKITEGLAVIYANNLLGKIVKVTPKVSFVQVLSDPQSKVPVRVETARGMVFGQFNSSIILDRIAQTENLSGVNYVFSSGEGESFPPDLVVGKLGKIMGKETDLFQTAEVLPLVNLDKLTTVFVVL